MEQMVKQIADVPDKARVEEVSGEAAVVYEIHVVTEDVGKIIGKGGRIIEAIRALLSPSSASKHDPTDCSLTEILGGKGPSAEK